MYILLTKLEFWLMQTEGNDDSNQRMLREGKRWRHPTSTSISTEQHDELALENEYESNQLPEMSEPSYRRKDSKLNTLLSIYFSSLLSTSMSTSSVSQLIQKRREDIKKEFSTQTISIQNQLLQISENVHNTNINISNNPNEKYQYRNNEDHTNQISYSLDSLVSYNIYSPTAIYMYNNENVPLPKSLVAVQENENDFLLVTHNTSTNTNDGDDNNINLNDIEHVFIENKQSSNTREYLSLGENSMFVSLNDDDETQNHISENGRKFFGKPPQKDCHEFNIIDLAIVYDNTYCKKAGGKMNAEREITAVMALVSRMYQQSDLCIKVQVTYMEGYCSSDDDPYDGMVTRKKTEHALKEFSEYWFNQRSDVSRSIAHLFTGRDFLGLEIGKGFIGTLCRNRFGYSVIQMTGWTFQLQAKASLVAHELGHNLGARHLNPHNNNFLNSYLLGYIMYEYISFGNKGFHKNSIEDIQKLVQQRSCTKKEFLT